MDYPLDFAVGRPRHSDAYPFIDPGVSLKNASRLRRQRRQSELLAPSCRILVRGDADVADKESVKTLMDSLPEVPDILVHNTAAIDESNPDWHVHIITTAYLGALKEACKTKARIINVGSIASWRYVYGRSSYAASKYIDREQQATGNDIRCVNPEAIIGRITDKAELSGATAVYLSMERAKYLMGRFVLATWDMEGLE
ncbi:hypothetical protein V8C35DRAFT_325035 [Trichoderma chlorosporum]